MIDIFMIVSIYQVPTLRYSKLLRNFSTLQKVFVFDTLSYGHCVYLRIEESFFEYYKHGDQILSR